MCVILIHNLLFTFKNILFNNTVGSKILFYPLINSPPIEPLTYEQEQPIIELFSESVTNSKFVLSSLPEFQVTIKMQYTSRLLGL